MDQKGRLISIERLEPDTNLLSRLISIIIIYMQYDNLESI